MHYSPKIEMAIKIATSAHDGIYRSAYDYPLPYVSHLFSVASIVSEYSDDEEVIAAALLHDVLEDTDYKIESMREALGERVANLVFAVTELFKADKHLSSWRERKELYIKKLETAEESALLIASADKIHNMQSALETPTKIKIKDPAQYAWFHDSVFAVIEAKLGKEHPLVTIHRKTLCDARNIFLPLSISMTEEK